MAVSQIEKAEVHLALHIQNGLEAGASVWKSRNISVTSRAVLLAFSPCSFLPDGVQVTHLEHGFRIQVDLSCQRGVCAHTDGSLQPTGTQFDV